MIWNKEITYLIYFMYKEHFFYLNPGFNYDVTMTYRLITR